ncbi:MAG: ABC transporter permease [Nanoarchaeota archaeon]|nr:ABC transporter permease [Nanoarchaeota archaeon]MCG2718239.1 ABC transporter permease [Nanoarchaeota archaeon]
MLREYLIFAIKGLKHRRLRTWLTILGIVIGIGAIIALISISQGLENAIVEQFEKMGTGRLYIMPEGLGASAQVDFTGLTTKDVDRLEKMPEVEWTNPYLIGSEEVEFSKQKRFVQVIAGIDTDGLADKWEDMDIGMGSGFMPNKKQTGIAILGYKIATERFDKDVHVKNKIKIRDKEFRVFGILEEIGNDDDDTAVWIDIDDFRELFDKPDEVNMIELKIKDGLDPNDAALKIETRLKKFRDDDTFQVITPEQILEQIGGLLDVIQMVLGGIAAISLVVGGVGIMNSMYTSVLQRKKEIGIMKSVGAKNKDIVMLFVVEAGFIGLIGGVIGAAFGSAIALSVGVIAAQAGFALLSVKISPFLLLFGLFFAIVVGMAAGALPARQAAKLRPAEALRG